MSIIPDTPTDDLIAEFTELRGPYGQVPEGLTMEQIRDREIRLGELYRALQERDALPPLVSLAPGFRDRRSWSGGSTHGFA
jgi:hypothetical protein